MLSRAKGLLNEALELPEKDRADLAGRLILSLHPHAGPDVEAAWAREIDRRLDGFEERKARSRPWSSIKRSVLKTQRARARRKALSRG
ncbi:MAG: addiction module protein [Acidobacteria bacterium]|nr:addiction module protein [Acidobacteriota bacterium]